MSCDQVTRCLNAENQAKMGNTENTNNFNKTQHMQLQDTKEVLKGSKSNRMNKAHIFYEILSQKNRTPRRIMSLKINPLLGGK